MPIFEHSKKGKPYSATQFNKLLNTVEALTESTAEASETYILDAKITAVDSSAPYGCSWTEQQLTDTGFENKPNGLSGDYTAPQSVAYEFNGKRAKIGEYVKMYPGKGDDWRFFTTVQTSSSSFSSSSSSSGAPCCIQVVTDVNCDGAGGLSYNVGFIQLPYGSDVKYYTSSDSSNCPSDC